MSKNALASSDTDAADLGRKPPPIAPDDVQTNVDGMYLRELFVRLPAGLTADDLKEAGIWKKVQVNRLKSLRKLDRLVMVTDDESAMFEATVAEAGSTAVTLAGIRRTDLKSRHGALFSDPQYRVIWLHGCYAVERKSDKQIVSNGLGSEELAVREISRMYPKAA